MMGGNGEVKVPPGFRFHPTDEELLYYYLKKKVSFEPIELDVIREVDLNKLEPWDLKDKCRIGSGPQNEWYFFSHKDKKYPTGTRTNRATTAGFWKATGRDKPIHLTTNDDTNKRIGMRKTLVFYMGRAPHGHKTDWIMHEYRLIEDEDDHNQHNDIHEDGWVVCRVFKKKNPGRGTFTTEPAFHHNHHQHEPYHHHHENDNHDHNYLPSHDNVNMTINVNNIIGSSPTMATIQANSALYHQQHLLHRYNLDGSMQLPQLFSPESTYNPLCSLNPSECCSQDLLKLTATMSANNNSNAAGSAYGGGRGGLVVVDDQQQQSTIDNHHRIGGGGGGGGGNGAGDWSFLDKLLQSHHCHQQINDQSKLSSNTSSSSLAFPYFGFETDILKFSK